MMSTAVSPSLPILLVDDEKFLLQSFEIALNANGFNNILCCSDSCKVMGLLEKQEVEVMLLDLTMPHLLGEELLSFVVEKYPDLPVVIVTGTNDAPTAVRCIKTGAYDYLVKPVEEESLIAIVNRCIEVRDLKRENGLLKKQVLTSRIQHPEAFSEIVTQDKVMHSIFRYTEAIAPTKQPVLITGETGVGKDLIARAIHRLSGLRGRFVTVNVGGLDDNIFADTLFGHKKGAFTGAANNRGGLVEQASGGTLFLDEIGDLSNASQVKLLRLLQEREYLPLGEDSPRHTDSRIIVATHCEFSELRKSGEFRNDLFYRLQTHHVHIPPLRERIEDLPLLLDHFLAKAALELNTNKPTPPEELIVLLNTYDFPGNVRELESMVFDAVSSHTSGKLSMNVFKKAMSRKNSEFRKAKEQSNQLEKSLLSSLVSDQIPTLKEAEAFLINEALRRARGNQTIAAQLLGVTRQTINRHLKNQVTQNSDQS